MSEAVKTEDLFLPGLQGVSTQLYTLDFGGSLIKLLYRDQTSRQEADVFKLAIFNSDDLEGLISYINQHVALPPDLAETFTTGVGMKRHNDTLSAALNTRFVNLIEFECFVKALKLVLPTIPKDRLFYPLPKSQFNRAYKIALEFEQMDTELKKKKMMASNSSGIPETIDSPDLPPLASQPGPDQLYDSYGDGDLFPAVMVMCSSGFVFTKYVDLQSDTEILGYSPRGGKALHGLGSLLTGVKTFAELMELADQATDSKVDTYIRDLKGGEKDDFYSLFPDDAYCFSFGTACGKDRDEFSRADLAASAVMYVCSDLTQMALTHAVNHKVKSVIMCGTLITHPVIQKAVTLCFLENSLAIPLEAQPKLRMCTVGPYLGVIGAWITGMEKEQKSS